MPETDHCDHDDQQHWFQPATTGPTVMARPEAAGVSKKQAWVVVEDVAATVTAEAVAD